MALIRSRVEAVAAALTGVDLRAVEVIESGDPQYKAVARVASVYGPPGVALVVGNALVSYRLSLPGEVYWEEFADHLESRGPRLQPEKAAEIVAEFIRSSRGNRMVLEQKIARLRRAAPALAELARNPFSYTDLTSLIALLRRSLQVRGDEKTVVFAAKMAYYFYRALGLAVRGREEVPLPVDRRMALLTSTSRMVEAPPEEIMASLRREALKAWRSVSEASGIPMLNLDALVWLPARGIERLLRTGLGVARDEYARRLVSQSRGLIGWAKARRIAAEVLYREPVTRR
ncbi:MAG: N-glycosylase/DNA lyase [Crenarchaeota archaeon]|nr:N-glycosylase/DNA lyase [Thermoproteota archaeon]